MPRAVAAPDPPLQDGRIRLDPMTHDDRADLWALAQEPGIVRYTYVPTGATEDFIPGWIQRYVDGWTDGSRAGFLIRDANDDTFFGFGSIVNLDLHAKEGEIGYALVEAARGRGAASGAVTLLTDWAFTDLGLERLELHIDATNTASAKVAERCGYRCDGVLRSVHFKEGMRCDLAIWSRLRSDPT